MSYIEHSRAAIDRVCSDMTVRAAHITLRDATAIGDRFARIVCQASASASPEAIFKGMREQMKGVMPVKGSFVTVAKSGTDHVMEGIVGLIPERVVLTDENKGSFKAIAGSMYEDGDQNLWTLKANDAGEIMVKSICQDDAVFMSQLLSLSATNYNDFDSRKPLQESAALRASIQGGDLLSYVSPTTNVVEMAIACADISNADGSSAHQIAVVRADGSSEVVNRELIVAGAHHEIEEADDVEVATAAVGDLASIAAYYAKMFARRPAYYEMFMQRFRAHAFM